MKIDKERVTDRLGRITETIASIHIPAKNTNYTYRRKYKPNVAQAEIDRDAVTLVTMAEEQDIRQDDMHSIHNTQITANGLTALVTDVAVHIEGPGQCALFVMFYVRERKQWVKETYRATSPLALPTVEDVQNMILEKLSSL